MECCAVTVRLGSWDTTVASFYVRPKNAWNTSSLLPLTARLGCDFLLCGDLNGHHTARGGHRCCAQGRAAADVIVRAGLKILNTGEPAFARRGVRTAIDISLATECCAYAWSICPDSWGSGHFPIFLATNTGPASRTRVCSTVNWDIFRRLRANPAEGDFLQRIVNSAQAATILSRTQHRRPVPDIKQLQLWATRRGQSIAQSGAPGRRTGWPLGGSTLSVVATQTDDGSTAGKLPAVPSPTLGAAQLLGDFCGSYSVGQPFVSLSQWPSCRASRNYLWQTSWRANLRRDHQDHSWQPVPPMRVAALCNEPFQLHEY
ncbi:hypothetical protein HPB52_021702 [Rhipicephalus sanguineus]|uniref:Endonuclease/exonuclease/phosphatase domain-containing protein n=1 Tax=Rhipicephalus sanguineus TaxID=34632 RepID=A0A9D4T4F3_RHISA|nr:hypothetical protein HPB52_021702 [Rhipicephalus sanguineus]